MNKTAGYICFVLRHGAKKLGLDMDREAWVSSTSLLEVCKNNGHTLSVPELHSIVKNDDKGRYTFKQDGEFIRANQGHSIKGIDLNLEVSVPPATLYHGTSTKYMDHIMAEGLKPMDRHHVHLSQDFETAVNVAKRRKNSVPIVLFVDAVGMHVKGDLFYKSTNGVWLTDYVPPINIGVVDLACLSS